MMGNQVSIKSRKKTWSYSNHVGVGQESVCTGTPHPSFSDLQRLLKSTEQKTDFSSGFSFSIFKVFFICCLFLSATK